jgi:prepilin-type N-terminal cleavage/methylation domain-containing protein
VIYSKASTRGFTLLEVMAALFIISVVISILGNSFILSYKNEINNQNKFREKEYINQAYSILEYAIAYQQKSLMVAGSDIVITREDDGIDRITVKGSNLVILYDGFNINYILKDVSVFNPVRKGNLLYITIGYKGDNYTRCIEEKDMY